MVNLASAELYIYVLGDILKSYTGELLILGAILGSS